jgi:hypothetical protein
VVPQHNSLRRQLSDVYSWPGRLGMANLGNVNDRKLVGILPANQIKRQGGKELANRGREDTFDKKRRLERGEFLRRRGKWVVSGGLMSFSATSPG